MEKVSNVNINIEGRKLDITFLLSAIGIRDIIHLLLVESA